jgi:hypothetical protein
MDWPQACAALSCGECGSANFRRFHAVRQVVETLGPSDAIHFARWIRHHHGEWLETREFAALNDWGNPIQAPSILLGAHRPFSPTSLRYLAHALWLADHGFVHEGGTVIEIGVGFGGLAATNTMVSRASTMFVDIPEVVDAATMMMRENGLSSHVIHSGGNPSDYCFISNYAFTELHHELQKCYFNRYIRDAPRGVILSNAGVFAQNIGGMTDHEIVSWFRAEGLPAHASQTSGILGPADFVCNVCLIHWNHDQPDGIRS